MAGTIARRHSKGAGETDRPRERSPEAGSNRRRPGRPPFRSVVSPQAADHPDENGRGADAIDQQASGPGRAEMLANRMTREWCVVIPCSRRACMARPPAPGANLRRAQPHERRRTARGKNQPSGQAAEDRETRVRNVACEKRPRRMTRFDPGRREPAPTDVVGRLMSASIQQG
jgi:hypothetical protein